MLNESAWKDRVELRIYHLDEDRRLAEKFGPVAGSTVLIDGKKLNGLTTYGFFHALEEAATREE
jgi:hypothetical protein